MAKKPKVKCPKCKESFYREDCEHVHAKNRYWHKECYETKDEAATKEDRDKELLEAYIKKLFGVKSLPPRVPQQIKTLRTKNDYSYSSIMLTLKHFYEIKGGDLKKSNNGIGIVPFVYDDARAYYEKLHYAEEQNKDVGSMDLETVNVIRIQKPKPRKSHIKTVDLDLLEKEVLDELP